ncbi:transcriptional regulator [Veronia nyctiphanis]|uniref:Transcriptional regulator n=1 Tax=Veronia nyctiphanis TaxID=1278244 RepID=A0A4Q0YU16_9GAMM|nr:Rho-binding antiterminator [Veronia nyctiphanis]RXJ74243.1 transcriptional regulator [Veronia nyctiphanis]
MINCDVHDIVEVACVYKIKVELSLSGGKQIIGVATDTKVTDEKREYMVINSGKQLVDIEMDSINKMKAVEVNPHFDEVEFT